MAKQSNRKLRICGKYRSNKEVPELRLVGNWFEALGFGIGDQVSITAREKLLIIQPVSAKASTEKPVKEHGNS